MPRGRNRNHGVRNHKGKRKFGRGRAEDPVARRTRSSISDSESPGVSYTARGDNPSLPTLTRRPHTR